MKEKSIFLRWTEADIKNLGMAILYTEVTKSGTVTREVGINSSGVVIHKFPTSASPRGCFDLAILSMENIESDISSQEFEQLWSSSIEL